MAEIVVKLVNGELAGQTAQTIAKNVREATQELNKARVGTEEWVKAAKKLDDVKQVQADYKTQLDATSKASDSLKKSFSSILDQIPGFSQISGAMRSASGGVGGLTSGFGLLKGAIAATGIGLLVIAVSTLVMWFSKTETGANVLSGSLKAIGNVVNLLFGKMMEIGKALFTAFQNPKQLLIDLVEFIGNNLLNRLKAFVVIWDGIKNFDLKKVTDGFIQLNTGITDATDKMAKFGKEVANAAVEGYNFVQIMDDIEDRQAQMEITAKENENLVNQLLLQAKNIGLEYDKRIIKLNEADAITRKSYANQLALSKEYADAVKNEVAAELTKQGLAVTADNYTSEQRDKIKEATLAYLNLKGQEIEIEEKIANRREQILGKQEKAEEKAAAAKQKQLDDEEKARQNILELRASDQAKGEKQEIDAILAGTQGKIDALVGSEAQITEQKLLLEDIAQRQIQEIKDKYATVAAKKEVDDATRLNDLKLTTEVNGLSERFLAGQLSQQEYIALNEKAVKDSEQRKLNIIKKAHGEESKEYQDQYKKILDQNVKFAEASGKQVAQAVASTASTLGNIFGELASLMGASSEAAKSLMIAQAIMSSIAGAINAYQSAADIPYVGFILAPIAAAAALAAGYANVEKIKNTQIPKPTVSKKEDGGLLDGPLHSDGGIPARVDGMPPLELEGGEFLFSRKATRALGIGRLTRANNYYTKGRQFEAGGPINPFDSSRGPIPSSASMGSDPSSEMRELKEAFLTHAKATDARFDRIQVHNNVQDTEKGIQVINSIKDEANV